MRKAEKVMQAFLKAWKERDFISMFNSTQVTWKETSGSPAILMAEFGAHEITDFEIVKTNETKVKLVYDIEFRVKHKGVWTETAIARLLCEKSPYKADKAGTWGVNPISAIGIFTRLKGVS